jgi:hypothetical protein
MNQPLISFCFGVISTFLGLRLLEFYKARKEETNFKII